MRFSFHKTIYFTYVPNSEAHSAGSWWLITPVIYSFLNHRIQILRFSEYPLNTSKHSPFTGYFMSESSLRKLQHWSIATFMSFSHSWLPKILPSPSTNLLPKGGSKYWKPLDSCQFLSPILNSDMTYSCNTHCSFITYCTCSFVSRHSVSWLFFPQSQSLIMASLPSFEN